MIIDKVYDEVLVGTDNLPQWLKKNKISKASTGTVSVVNSLGQVTQISQDLVNSGYYSGQQAMEEFVRGVDPYLIAFCKANNFVCVTEEKINNQNPNQKKFKKIKIPDITARVNVTCINTIEMLRQLKVSI